jgi:DeoR/GlpR family transcriptional regulator of sugar metabolism
LIKEFGISEITFKRDIQKLKGLVEFRGPQKTGSYYLTKEMENKLKE